MNKTIFMSIGYLFFQGLAYADELKTTEKIICRSDLIRTSLKDVKTNRILVTAHRGAHGPVPENSLAAIDHAIKLGVDIIELDVRLTRDGIPVLMHDPNLARTTNGHGSISNSSWPEIQKLYLKRADGSASKERIPTLEKALLLAKDRIIIDLDLKTKDIKNIINTVIKTNSQRDVIFFHKNLSLLSDVRNKLPAAMVMPLAKKAKEARFLADKFSLEVIHLRTDYNSYKLGDFLDRHGVAGWVNSLGRVDKLLLEGSDTALDPLIKNKADIIQTDHPSKVIKILGKQGLRINYQGLTGDAPCKMVVQGMSG